METKPNRNGKKRSVYPLDITSLKPLIRKTQRETKIKSQAVLLRMGIERGLPILSQQLSYTKPEVAP